jgi:hypothetical protein
MKTLRQRFTAKVWINFETGCWEWTATRNKKGYGVIWDGKTRGAHRVAYELFVGPIPEGLQLDHLCRVRHCVNPAHLEPVTCRENLLRGETITAKRAAVTECPKGHKYSQANTYYRPDGCRECRLCKNEGSTACKQRKIMTAKE